MKFFVTFGQKYRDEPHPNGMHPDGWAEVDADSYESARSCVVRTFGTQWCWLYDEADFDPRFYPQGCLMSLITRDGPSPVTA